MGVGVLIGQRMNTDKSHYNGEVTNSVEKIIYFTKSAKKYYNEIQPVRGTIEMMQQTAVENTVLEMMVQSNIDSILSYAQRFEVAIEMLKQK